MTEGTLLWLWLWPDQTCILACPYWLHHCLSLSSSLYFSISPTFWVGNTIMTIFQPHMRHCGPTDCSAGGNLFPMIHIHQMTLKSHEFGSFKRLAFFHLWTQSATPNSYFYCQWFRFNGAVLFYVKSSPKSWLTLVSFPTCAFLLLRNAENIIGIMFWTFLFILWKSMVSKTTWDPTYFHQANMWMSMTCGWVHDRIILFGLSLYLFT